MAFFLVFLPVCSVKPFHTMGARKAVHNRTKQLPFIRFSGLSGRLAGNSAGPAPASRPGLPSDGARAKA
jgi:hypothetical protein